MTEKEKAKALEYIENWEKYKTTHDVYKMAWNDCKNHIIEELDNYESKAIEIEGIQKAIELIKQMK